MASAPAAIAALSASKDPAGARSSGIIVSPPPVHYARRCNLAYPGIEDI